MGKERGGCSERTGILIMLGTWTAIGTAIGVPLGLQAINESNHTKEALVAEQQYIQDIGVLGEHVLAGKLKTVPGYSSNKDLGGFTFSSNNDANPDSEETRLQIPWRMTPDAKEMQISEVPLSKVQFLTWDKDVVEETVEFEGIDPRDFLVRDTRDLATEYNAVLGEVSVARYASAADMVTIELSQKAFDEFRASNPDALVFNTDSQTS